jgi:hypothetical protein
MARSMAVAAHCRSQMPVDVKRHQTESKRNVRLWRKAVIGLVGVECPFLPQSGHSAFGYRQCSRNPFTMLAALTCASWLATIFAICGLSRHPPLLLMVKSPGVNVFASANSKILRSTTGRSGSIKSYTSGMGLLTRRCASYAQPKAASIISPTQIAQMMLMKPPKLSRGLFGVSSSSLSE